MVGEEEESKRHEVPTPRVFCSSFNAHIRGYLPMSSPTVGSALSLYFRTFLSCGVVFLLDFVHSVECGWYMSYVVSRHDCERGEMAVRCGEECGDEGEWFGGYTLSRYTRYSDIFLLYA